ncbi:hypothetical protein D7X33_35590 [Butyricicoccus sp. 1XD8-22]|nr:hypothetical protein D7X33_35590 [Butyricicoccus sp. 1XD8-22]
MKWYVKIQNYVRGNMKDGKKIKKSLYRLVRRNTKFTVSILMKVLMKQEGRTIQKFVISRGL